MSLRNLIAADTAMFFAAADGADSVIYRAPDGTQTTVTANVWDMQTENRDVRGIQTIISTRNITVWREELDSLNLRGTFVIDEQEWSISVIVYQDDTVITAQIQRHELHEHARPGYRRQ